MRRVNKAADDRTRGREGKDGSRIRRPRSQARPSPVPYMDQCAAGALRGVVLRAGAAGAGADGAPVAADFSGAGIPDLVL